MLRCGRPGPVSSILTATVGVVGTAPMPVYGFFTGGAGGAGVGVGVVAVLVVGVTDADFFGLLSPPHAAVASKAATASDAAMARRERVMIDPLPSWGAKRSTGGPLGGPPTSVAVRASLDWSESC